MIYRFLMASNPQVTKSRGERSALGALKMSSNDESNRFIL